MQASNSNMLLLQKFSTKKQLYCYLSQRLRVFLPPIADCRMEWLQMVFTGEKAVVLQDTVPHFQVPTQPQLSVKLIYHELQGDTEIMQYFDTERVSKSGKYPPRPFFWGILFALRRELCDRLMQEVMDRKLMRSQQLVQASQNMAFQQVWVDKLLEHPVVSQAGESIQFDLICPECQSSSCVGSSSRQTNLLYQMQQARRPPRRQPVEIPDTMKQYQAALGRPLSDHSHVNTKRRHPNVIKNASEDEEWKQSME